MTFEKFFVVFILIAAFNSDLLVKCDDNLIFEYFYGSALNPQIEFFNVDNFATLVDHPAFRHGSKSVVYHFGAGETSRDARVAEIITSYLYHGDYNVIVIDYNDVSVISDENAENLSESIVRGLLGLLDNYSSEYIEFLGNEAGANVLSFTAEKIALHGHIVSRITGLNPTRLSATAFFTDSIHSEESSHAVTGQVAFFVNGGFHPQPNCGQQVPCSREFAQRVYAESARSRTPNFPALPCDSWDDFRNNLCNENGPIGNMGLHAQSNLRGHYFLQTNTREPWSRASALPSGN